MPDSGPALLDTNVLLYSVAETGEEAKKRVAVELIQRLHSEGRGAVSVQVLQEFYVNMVRKYGVGPSVALQTVEGFTSWPVFETDVPAVLQASNSRKTPSSPSGIR